MKNFISYERDIPQELFETFRRVQMQIFACLLHITRRERPQSVYSPVLQLDGSGYCGKRERGARRLTLCHMRLQCTPITHYDIPPYQSCV